MGAHNNATLDYFLNAMSDNDELQQIAHLRREYTRGGLRRHDLPAEPLPLFERWLRQACDAKLADPTAMVVATVDENGNLTSVLLLKHYDEKGLVFYTNLGSRKAHQIEKNPASACFSVAYAGAPGDGDRQSGTPVDAGSGEIFPQPSARQPDWRLGLASSPAASLPAASWKVNSSS
jgi:hypothetical protein